MNLSNNKSKFYTGKTIAEFNSIERKLFENDLVMLLGLTAQSELKNSNALDDDDPMIMLTNKMLQSQINDRTNLVAELVPHLKFLPDTIRQFMVEKTEYGYKKFLDDVKAMMESLDDDAQFKSPFFDYILN